MRRDLLRVLVLVVALAIGVVTAAAAKTAKTKIQAGNMVLTFGGGILPDKLPRHKYAPVSANVFGKIATNDGTHPSALRETVVNVDRDIRVNVKGYPTCTARKLEARNTAAAKRVCGKTVLGRGIAHAEIAFPEQRPIIVSSPLLVFNGGQRGGKVLLLIHTFITVPAPTAIVTQVTVQKKGSGLHTIAKIPAIAGGSGSALDFKFKLGKTYNYKGRKLSYLEARCPDGFFGVSSPKTLFRNEARVPGVPPKTVLRGGVKLPCTPKG